MDLKPGEKLGPYEIVSLLGKGGMGEVWRARDSRLNRDVAIKTSRAGFSGRFKTEAQAVAALNHTNVCTLHDVGPDYLVMELVEGPTLADRIRQGPIPLDEALGIAKQIADGLEAAHEKGITHRDLKPANVKIRPDGSVKVLDFGLAKAGTEPGDLSSDSPTLMSIPGTILGTAAYMSPEQARGNPVDKRSDIWSFGVVLYEMLTGKRLFDGATVSDCLAAILVKEPDLSPAPAKVRRLLARCLEKDPNKRLRWIGDWAELLEEANPAVPPPPQARGVAERITVAGWIAAGVLASALAVVLWAPWRAAKQADRPLIRLSVDLGPEAVAGPRTTAVLSPDGTRMVYLIRTAAGGPLPLLALRQLDQANFTPLNGTQGGADPFFSPDGQWIGFFADGKLKKVAVQGGAPVSLCDAPSERGGSWGEDGNIIFVPTNASSLMRVPAAGGAPQPVKKLSEGETSHRWPQILPGGTAVLFTVGTDLTNFQNASIEVVSLKTGEVKTVQRGGYFGRYVPSPQGVGHLLYVHEGTLFATAFDPDRLETRGTPIPLLDDVASDTNAAGGQFDGSRNGSLVYLSGRTGSNSYPIAWMESSGKTAPLLAKPGAYGAPRFSPDGKRLAFTAPGGKGTDVWVYDWERDTPTQLTFTGPGNLELVWTPDGKHIVFGSVSGSAAALWWTRSDGSGEPQKLLDGKNAGLGLRPQSFTPDGKRLAFADNLANGAEVNLYTLPLDVSDPDHPRPGKPEPFLVTPAREVDAAFSPDGHWMAYASNESGVDDVFVRPFPGPGGKWRISTGGGKVPTWSRDGRELFFLGGDDHIMVTDYTANGESFNAGKPRVWSERKVLRPGIIRVLDLHPDGKRFAVFERPEAEKAAGNLHVTFLLNFADELQRKVPVGK